MSGHSKWSTIKHKKAAKDARRGKLFTKFIKEITVAARMGGGDAATNPRLRTAVQTARDNSMPNENIERAIKKGTGELEGVSYEEVSYEGYGPGGAAFLVQAWTDNRNRTVSDIRRLFSKHGGSLGETGCVAWMFDSKGLIVVSRDAVEEEALLGLALEAGAEDVTESDDVFEVVTRPEDFAAVRESLDNGKVPMLSAEVAMIPRNTMKLGEREAEQTLSLTEDLEDLDDVQSVAANFDIPADLLEKTG